MNPMIIYVRHNLHYFELDKIRINIVLSSLSYENCK